MTENSLVTRAAICGAGILGAIIVVMGHLPLVLLAVPVVIVFLGIVADPKETHATWYGALNTIRSKEPRIPRKRSHCTTSAPLLRAHKAA